MLDVTVAIPTVGRMEMLTACLNSIVLGTKHPAELLILDQSGKDQVSVLASKFPQLPIKVIKVEGRGIARNMNAALRLSRFDNLLVTHDDCTVASDWVEQSTRALTQCGGGMVTGRVLPGGDDPKAVPSTISWNEAFDYTGTRAHGVLFPNNMGVSRKQALEIEGFDQREGFLTAAEDLDFSYRWLVAGKCLRYCPAMVVTHNDWRDPDQLVALYKHYARCAGRFYGKHWYLGDTTPLKQGLKDIKSGIGAWGQKLIHGTARHHNQKLEMPVWVPIGIMEGLLESRRIEKSRK